MRNLSRLNTSIILLDSVLEICLGNLWTLPFQKRSARCFVVLRHGSLGRVCCNLPKAGSFADSSNKIGGDCDKIEESDNNIQQIYEIKASKFIVQIHETQLSAEADSRPRQNPKQLSDHLSSEMD